MTKQTTTATVQVFETFNGIKFILLLTICISLAQCDCPIQRYHSQFKLGQISSILTSSTSTNALQTNYTYSLDVPFIKAIPSVAIGITGFDYTPFDNSCNFQIEYLDSSSSLSQLVFSISSKGVKTQSRIFSFRFFTIDKRFKQLQAGSFTKAANDNLVSKKLPGLSASATNNPEILLFLNGINIDYISLTSFTIQLINPVLSQNTLNFNIKLTPSGNTTSVSVSYLIYSKTQFITQNQVSIKTLSFDTSLKALSLTSLQFSDLTFYGLSSLSFKPTETNILDLTLDQTDNFKIQGTAGNNFRVLVWQSYIKSPFICSFCKDGSILYENKYCVSVCPRDYIAQNGLYIKECRKCDITALRIPDSKNTKCVCASQYFENASGQCVSCHYTCLTCLSESNNQCLTCDFTAKVTFRQLSKTNSKSLTGSCTCPAVGYYEEDQNVKCQVCHSDCKTCTGPEYTDCVECNSQRTINQFGTCQCKNGYSSKKNGDCVCLNPKFQVNGQCTDPISICGLNQIQITSTLQTSNNSSKNNKNSSKNKAKCQCRTGFYKVKGQCVTCSQNQQYNDKKGKCQCVASATKTKSGDCVVCGKGKKYNNKNQTCECSNKNQREDSKGNCVLCPNKKSIFYNDTCLCINNYFMNSKGKCQKCKKKSDNPECKPSDQDL